MRIEIRTLFQHGTPTPSLQKEQLISLNKAFKPSLWMSNFPPAHASQPSITRDQSPHHNHNHQHASPTTSHCTLNSHAHNGHIAPACSRMLCEKLLLTGSCSQRHENNHQAFSMRCVSIIFWPAGRSFQSASSIGATLICICDKHQVRTNSILFLAMAVMLSFHDTFAFSPLGNQLLMLQQGRKLPVKTKHSTVATKSSKGHLIESQRQQQR
jgi:hypothetical protein